MDQGAAKHGSPVMNIGIWYYSLARRWFDFGLRHPHPGIPAASSALR